MDIITCFKFCVNRLRGLGSATARGQILPFSIELSPLSQGCATACLWYSDLLAKNRKFFLPPLN